MEFIATQKFLLISPRKIREIALLARRMKPADAINKLTFSSRHSAIPLIKVIKAAIANAKVKGVTDGLKFKEIQIGEGPRLKRGRPVSRGQWHPIKKRMSHIRVVLTTTEKPKEKTMSSEAAKSKELKKGENGTKD